MTEPQESEAPSEAIPRRVFCRVVNNISAVGVREKIDAFADNQETRNLPCFPDLIPFVPEALLREARAKAFEEAIKCVNGWRDLIETNHRTILADNGYIYPQEASREYRNQANLLSAIYVELARAARGEK